MILTGVVVEVIVIAVVVKVDVFALRVEFETITENEKQTHDLYVNNKCLFLSLILPINSIEKHLCEILVFADVTVLMLLLFFCDQLVATPSRSQCTKCTCDPKQRNERLNKKYVIAIKYKRSQFFSSFFFFCLLFILCFVLVSSTFLELLALSG